ncbi:MAG: hypothetical protein H0T92_08110 [Pyrinomonadaceae bacterium]|nr:hypothetical protein [Pyrinomonadaceae bacterium]
MFSAVTPLVARQRPAPGPSMRERELHDREMGLRNIGREIKVPTNERQQKLLFEQNKENFKRIQLLNNELMRAASVSNALNYQRVADKAAEVRKRANQLKSALPLPPPESGQMTRQSPQDTLDDKQLRALLSKLDQTIADFVVNPVFRQPLINDKHLNKASLDLETIAELSRSISKAAEKLHKKSAVKP